MDNDIKEIMEEDMRRGRRYDPGQDPLYAYKVETGLGDDCNEFSAEKED